MKIVIDIPKEAYELLKSKRVLDNIAESIIANGTPLPKGRGDLIDKMNTFKVVSMTQENFLIRQLRL